MKAADNIVLERTDGNTDPLLVRLQRQIDDTEALVNVSDAAVVTMDVECPTGNFSITGTANGDTSGIFSFAVASFPAGNHVMRFDIDVTESGSSATYARGEVYTHEKIAA